MLHMLFWIAAFASTDQPEWTWSTYPELGFKVLTPCVMLDNVNDVPTEVEVITYHQLSGGSLSDTHLPMSFVIDHYRLPGEQQLMNETELSAFFENTLDPIMEALEGTVVYAEIITDGGKDVCSWKATYRNGECIIRGESMIIDGRYYGMQAFGWTKHKPEDLMNKFFDSFRLIETASTATIPSSPTPTRKMK